MYSLLGKFYHSKLIVAGGCAPSHLRLLFCKIVYKVNKTGHKIVLKILSHLFYDSKKIPQLSTVPEHYKISIKIQNIPLIPDY